MRNDYRTCGDETLIYLTQGKITTVTTSDLPLIADRKWYAARASNGQYYAATRLTKGKQLWLHRVVTGTTDPARVVDHIDMDPMNNTRSNLRVTTRRGNSINQQALGRKSQSGRIGVYTAGPKWRSVFILSGNDRIRGRARPTIDEAALEWDFLALQHRSETIQPHNLNFGEHAIAAFNQVKALLNYLDGE